MLVLAIPLSAAAQAYSIGISGAGDFASLLDEHLEIRLRQNDANLPLEEVQRLVNGTPRQIRELLATEGYFSPLVRHELVRRDGQIMARFMIDLGPPTVVDTVDVRFAGDLAAGPHADPARMERLRRLWRIKPGERFRQTAWDEAKSALLKGLLNRGYPAAKITASEARIDPEKHNAALSVEVDSGPSFTFGVLQIQGLKRYSRDMVDALNTIEPGEAFSQDKLTELQVRLQDSAYFRTVFATIEVDPAHPRQAPIRLDLVENERRRLALGGGFSTDSGARLQAKWLDRHFLGRDWRLESELRLDRQTRVLGADLYFPPRANDWYPSLGTHYERTDISGETNDKVRVDARMTSPVKTDEQIYGVSWLTERQQVVNSEPNNRQALIGAYTYTRRRVDNPMTPHRGYAAALELSGGLRGVASEANIGRVVLRGNWLAPFARRWQAVLRGQVGHLAGASRNAVPSDLLFRAGGDQSVRGYAYNSLGVEQNGAIVGGRVMAVFSTELVYALTPTWGAAVFRDAGNAADSWHEFHLKQGSGIGARWRSPIGPVNIDFAYGHATRKPRLHFSVGYGF